MFGWLSSCREAGMVAIWIVCSVSDSPLRPDPHFTAYTKICLFWLSLLSASLWLLRWDFSSTLKTWYRWAIFFLFLALDVSWPAIQLPHVRDNLLLKLFSLSSWEENLFYCHTRHQDAKILLKLRSATTPKTQAKDKMNIMSWESYKNAKENKKADGRDINLWSI